MNTQLCPAPLAVDEFILFPRSLFINSSTATDELCDTNLIGFVIWFAILTVIKIITGLGLSFDWYSRYISAEGRANLERRYNVKNNVRYPIVPTMNVIQAAMFLILLVLSSSGICTSRTGCPLAFYSVQHGLSATYCIILLRQFIALGKRMIPLARSKLALLQGADGNSSGSSSDNPVYAGATGDPNIASIAVVDALSKEDLVLKAFIYIQVFSIPLQIIPGVIVFQLRLPDMLLNGPASTEEYNLLISLSFGFQAVFFLFNMSGYLVQLQRLIVATRMGCAQPYSKDVQVALSKMRQTQVGFTVMAGMAATLTFLVAIQVIPLHWFVFLLLMTIETTGTTLTFVKFVLGRLMKMQRRRRNAKRLDAKRLDHTARAPPTQFRGVHDRPEDQSGNLADQRMKEVQASPEVTQNINKNNKVTSVSNESSITNQQGSSLFIAQPDHLDTSSLVAFSASDQQQQDADS